MTKLKGLIWALGGATLPAKIFGLGVARPITAASKTTTHAEKKPSKDRTERPIAN